MKKNKNAFTLIELLAVIVILAIIALIATPIILGIVEDAKKDAFLRSVELVISTTDIDIANKTFEENYTYEITDGNISNLEVSVKNTDGMNGSIKYDVNGKEVYAINNGVYCVKKTIDMDKAEISDYVEGECKLPVPMPIYANGQRVYFDVYAGTGCTMEKYAESYENGDFANSKTGYNGLDGTGNQNNCLLFYAFNDDGGDSLNLLLDHNTNKGVSWGKYTEGPIYALPELKSATASWNGTITLEDYTVSQIGGGNYTINYDNDDDSEDYKARLITAQEIARITGADVKEELMFDESIAVGDFCLDLIDDDERYECSSVGIEWIFDRISYPTAGYWTGTSIISNYDDFGWFIHESYSLRDSDTNDAVWYKTIGVRPVIEVLKSKVTPGEAPVIPE